MKKTQTGRFTSQIPRDRKGGTFTGERTMATKLRERTSKIAVGALIGAGVVGGAVVTELYRGDSQYPDKTEYDVNSNETHDTTTEPETTTTTTVPGGSIDDATMKNIVAQAQAEHPKITTTTEQGK